MTRTTERLTVVNATLVVEVEAVSRKMIERLQSALNATSECSDSDIMQDTH